MNYNEEAVKENPSLGRGFSTLAGHAIPIPNDPEDLKLDVIRSSFGASLNELQRIVYNQNRQKGFWDDTTKDTFASKIALIHSELSEALEAHRKDLASDHLEGVRGIDEELADAFIRLLDLAGYENIDLASIVIAKLKYNLQRPFLHGKKY